MSFFCPHSVAVRTKYTSHRWYLYKRRCRRGLYSLQAQDISACLTTTAGKSGLCISDNCPVGESTLEEGVTIFTAFQNTPHYYYYYISTFRHFFLLKSQLQHLSFCVNVFSFRYEKTLPKTNEARQQSVRSNSRESEEKSRYEWGRCGVLRLAPKVSSWKKVEALRKCTLYPICYVVIK